MLSGILRVSLKKLMSWVRPGVFEAKASRPWRVSTLIVVDLPAFERPAKAISGIPAPGRSVSFAADVKKRADSKMDMGRSSSPQSAAACVCFRPLS